MPQQQLQGQLDAGLPVAQVERQVKRVRRERFDSVRREVTQIQDVAGPHQDLALDRSHLHVLQIGQINAARGLASIESPAFLAGEMNDQHVVGIQMAAIGFVAALREEHRRVGKRRDMSPVERGGQ